MKEMPEDRNLDPNTVVRRRCHVVVAGHIFIVKWQFFCQCQPVPRLQILGTPTPNHDVGESCHLCLSPEDEGSL